MRPGAMLRAAVFLLAATAVVSAMVGRAPLHRELAELKTAHAEAARLAATAAVQRLDEAQQRGDALSAQLLGREQEIGQLTKEKRDAVARSTRGRACLDPGTLRVLNGAAGLRVAAPAEAASGAAAADGPAAAYSSDSDIAPWIVDAGAQYEQCRERLDKLIDWHVKGPKP